MNFKPQSEPGGIAVDKSDNIIVCSYKTIEFYTADGEFIKSFDDNYVTCNSTHRVKNFQHVRKDVAFGSDEEVFVADANTNSLRGKDAESRV